MESEELSEGEPRQPKESKRDGGPARVSRLETLREINVLLHRALDPKAVARVVLDRLGEIAPGDAAMVLLREPGQRRLRVLDHRGLSSGFLEAWQLHVDCGLTLVALEQGSPLAVERIAGHSLVAQPAIYQEEGLASYLGVPLILEGGSAGLLAIYTRSPHQFSRDEQDFLTALGGGVAAALERSRLHERQQRAVRRLKAVAETAREFTVLDETQPLPQRATARIRQAFDCYGVSLLLMRGGVLEWVAGSGRFATGQLPYGAVIPSGRGIVAHVLATGEPWLAVDVSQDSHFEPFELLPDTRSEVAVPLRLDDEIIGVLDLHSTQVGGFDRSDIEGLLILADQVVAALENARLFAQVAYAKQEWEQTFDVMADSVMILSPDRRVLRCNRAAARLLDMEPRELIGRSCHEVFCGSTTPIPDCPVLETARTGRPASLESGPASGEHRVFHIVTAPRIGEGGQLTQVIHVARDVTEERRLRRQLIQAEKLSALGQLVSGVAHELNNPLTSVLGYAQLLEATEGVPPDVQQDLRRISGEAQRASQIVRNLLTFARERRSERSLVQVNSAIQRVLDLRSDSLQVGDINVVSELDPDLPETVADGYQLQQVFLDLITNAQQAMMAAHGRGALTIRSSSPDPDRILITFGDDGPGMDKGQMERVFDPFFTTKEPGEGTGLGLSICYGVILEHNGRIWAESELGQGATFFVELPVVSQEAEATLHKKPGLEALLPRGRILVVDADPAARNMLDELLGPLGHSVALAESVEAAQEMLETEWYDIIFLDLSDTGQQGFHQWLRERKPEAAQSVIFTVDESIVDRARPSLQEAGRPYLTKPFRPEEAIRIVRRCLTK